MEISSPFFQWDTDTQNSCVESMRWISRPMSWAARKISERQQPDSTICKVAIELLRRLNLPLIYFASETTFISCIAKSLWQKTRKCTSSWIDQRSKLDRPLSSTPFHCGRLVLLIAWRRVELFCEIIWQIFTGAVKIETEDRDSAAKTPDRPIVSRLRTNSGDLIENFPQIENQKMLQFYQGFWSISKKQRLSTRFDPKNFCSKSGNRSKGLPLGTRDGTDQISMDNFGFQEIDQEGLNRCKIEQSQFPLAPSTLTAVPCEIAKDLTPPATRFPPKSTLCKQLHVRIANLPNAASEPFKVSTPEHGERAFASQNPFPIAFCKFCAGGPARRAKSHRLKKRI